MRFAVLAQELVDVASQLLPARILDSSKVRSAECRHAGMTWVGVAGLFINTPPADQGPMESYLRMGSAVVTLTIVIPTVTTGVIA